LLFDDNFSILGLALFARDTDDVHARDGWRGYGWRGANTGNNGASHHVDNLDGGVAERSGQMHTERLSCCYNTEATGLPMEGNAIESVFKVYVTDIGLLVTMLGGSTRNDVIQGNLGGFKGAIYENLMADTLHKKEQNLYYYRKESGMELDFLINYKRECVPVEVKAKTAKAKSISTALKHPDKYDVYHAIKFGDYNIGRDGLLLTLPHYMQFLLDLEPEEIILEPIDVNAVNALAKEFLKQDSDR
jgi:hypothetical protein